MLKIVGLNIASFNCLRYFWQYRALYSYMLKQCLHLFDVDCPLKLIIGKGAKSLHLINHSKQMAVGHLRMSRGRILVNCHARYRKASLSSW